MWGLVSRMWGASIDGIWGDLRLGEVFEERDFAEAFLEVRVPVRHRALPGRGFGVGVKGFLKLRAVQFGTALGLRVIKKEKK